MKTFFRFLTLPLVWVWKFLSSGLTVLTNLIFLSCLLAVLVVAFHAPKVQIPAQSALVMDLEGDIVEERSPMDPITRAIGQMAGSPLHSEIFLQDLIDVIDAAADDPRIKLLVLDPSRLGDASLDQIQVIGKALDDFKKSGKKIIATGDAFNHAQYYLATWADKIYIHPMGTVNLRGFMVFRLYLREMLDKLAINFHVFRVGTFKSAVEPFLRDNMSAEDKEANRLWLGNLWTTYCEDVARHRKLTVENLTTNINNLVANLTSVNGDRSQLAVVTGLVDGKKTHQELEQLIKETSGVSASNTGYHRVDFRHYLQTISPSYASPGNKQQLIGIISASGNILHGKGTVGQIGSDDLIKRIRKARQDKRIKAIVLRITTGGGSAFASELIRQELLLAKQEGKPVIVSMGAMAASGGYWLAADADAIFASPVTLTGSIGIFGAIPTVEKTLANLGIHGDGVGTTTVAHFGNPATSMSPEEEQAYQLDVEQGYRHFLEIVAKGRKMKVAEVAKIAEGRVWDGATALKLGLVDHLGGLEEAIAEAAKRAKVPEDNGYFIELPSENLLDRLKKMDQPAEALAARFVGQAALSALFPQARPHTPLDFLLEGTDPRRLYAHSLLPGAGRLLQ